MKDRKEVNIRQKQAEDTRQKLLASAQKLFAENGYRGTSVRAINRNINLADGLLYHYFPGGKQEIFQAIVKENMNQILFSLDQEANLERYAKTPLEQLLDTLCRNFMEIMDDHIDIMRILFRENEVRGFVTKEQLLHLSGNREPWFPKVLRKKMEMGEIRVMDCEAASFALHSIFMNHVMSKIFGVGPSIIEDENRRKRLIDYHVNMWTDS